MFPLPQTLNLTPPTSVHLLPLFPFAFIVHFSLHSKEDTPHSPPLHNSTLYNCLLLRLCTVHYPPLFHAPLYAPLLWAPPHVSSFQVRECVRTGLTWPTGFLVSFLIYYYYYNHVEVFERVAFQKRRKRVC